MTDCRVSRPGVVPGGSGFIGIDFQSHLSTRNILDPDTTSLGAGAAARLPGVQVCSSPMGAEWTETLRVVSCEGPVVPNCEKVLWIFKMIFRDIRIYPNTHELSTELVSPTSGHPTSISCHPLLRARLESPHQASRL